TVNINAIYSKTVTASVCNGTNYTFPDGTTQNNIVVSTTHISNLQSAAGCDSIVLTNISVTPVYSQTVSASICSGSNYTFPDGSVQNNITSATTHTSNLQSVSGCDSIIATTVNVKPI